MSKAEEIIRQHSIVPPEMKSISVEDLDEDRGFKVRMEAALRLSALKIQEQSTTPEKFDPYIAEREKIIREILGDDVQLTYQGKIIFP